MLRCVHIYIDTYIHAYTCTCAYIRACICIHYIYIYVSIFIYTCINKGFPVSGHSMQHTTMLKGKAVSIIPKGKENLAAQVMQHFKNPDSEAVEEEEEKENAVTVEVSPMKAPSKAKAKGLANKKTQITSPLAAGKKRKAESPAATKTAGRPKRR